MTGVSLTRAQRIEQAAQGVAMLTQLEEDQPKKWEELAEKDREDAAMIGEALITVWDALMGFRMFDPDEAEAAGAEPPPAPEEPPTG